MFALPVGPRQINSTQRNHRHALQAKAGANVEAKPDGTVARDKPQKIRPRSLQYTPIGKLDQPSARIVEPTRRLCVGPGRLLLVSSLMLRAQKADINEGFQHTLLLPLRRVSRMAWLLLVLAVVASVAMVVPLRRHTTTRDPVRDRIGARDVPQLLGGNTDVLHVYVASVQFGSQWFSLQIDTGSSGKTGADVVCYGVSFDPRRAQRDARAHQRLSRRRQAMCDA